MTPYLFPDPTADSEREMPECPYCNAQIGVTFLRHEHEDGEVEVYKCYTCDTIFKVASEIPF